MPKDKIIISCFYDSLDKTILPIGFSWVETLIMLYKKKYKITILLHGGCIKYGLKSSSYYKLYNTKNPFKKFLRNLHKHNVKIVICKYCLQKDGFTIDQLLKFIKPINFSIDYIAQKQLEGSVIIYDANPPVDKNLLNSYKL